MPGALANAPLLELIPASLCARINHPGVPEEGLDLRSMPATFLDR